jgi:hypothetical protein
MEGGSTKSRNGRPLNGIGSIPIKDPMRTASTLKVTPLTVLQCETALLILYDLHVPIEIPDQSGIDNTGAVVQVIPMILPD